MEDIISALLQVLLKFVSMMAMFIISPILALFGTNFTAAKTWLSSIEIPAAVSNFFIQASQWCNVIFGIGFMQHIVNAWFSITISLIIIRFVIWVARFIKS